MDVVRMVVLVPLMTALILAPAPVWAQSGEALEVDQSSAPVERIGESFIEGKLHDALSNLEDVHLPSLGVFSFSKGDTLDITLSLTSLHLTGISNVKVPRFEHITEGTSGADGSQILDILLPRISLAVGNYNSAGHILNLPFNGEGPLSVILHDLAITLMYDWDDFNAIPSRFNFCATDNSTKVDLDLRRLQVHFSNLNAGTDQGQLVDIMLSSFGPDIFDFLEIKLNTDLNGPLDDALITAINCNLCQDYECDSLPDPSQTARNLFSLISSHLVAKLNG